VAIDRLDHRDSAPPLPDLHSISYGWHLAKVPDVAKRYCATWTSSALRMGLLDHHEQLLARLWAVISAAASFEFLMPAGEHHDRVSSSRYDNILVLRCRQIYAHEPAGKLSKLFVNLGPAAGTVFIMSGRTPGGTGGTECKQRTLQGDDRHFIGTSPLLPGPDSFFNPSRSQALTPVREHGQFAAFLLPIHRQECQDSLPVRRDVEKEPSPREGKKSSWRIESQSSPEAIEKSGPACATRASVPRKTEYCGC
jgi:hypothetical protein